MHPSLSEHFVRYIALYKDTAEIARIYLHPVFSAPKVTFTMALDESGTLRALAEPTHSAGWEASKGIAASSPERPRVFPAASVDRGLGTPGRRGPLVTVTVFAASPRRSCHRRTVYCPGGTLSSLKRPCASVIA